MLLYRVLTSRLRVQGRKYGLAQRGGFILRFKLYSLIKGYWALWVWQVNKLYRHLEGFSTQLDVGSSSRSNPAGHLPDPNAYARRTKMPHPAGPIDFCAFRA